MTKLMQKIVLFIEPNEDAWCTPSKIGHLFMNRFAIDEDASFEIVKVLDLGKSSWSSPKCQAQNGLSIKILKRRERKKE